MHLLNRRVAWFWPQIQMVFAHLVRRVQPRGGTVRIALPSDEWVYGRAVQTHQTNHGGGAQQTQQRSDERDPVLLVQACRSLGNSGWVKHSFFDQCLFNAFLLVLVFQGRETSSKRLLQKMLTCLFLCFVVDQARTYRKARCIVRPLGWNEAKDVICRRGCRCGSRGFVKFERTKGWNRRRRGVKWWTCFCSNGGSRV